MSGNKSSKRKAKSSESESEEESSEQESSEQQSSEESSGSESDSPAPKKGRKASTKKSTKKPVKKSRKKKDPKAPKKAMTGYMAYQQAVRAQVKAEQSKLDFGDLSRKVGAQWKEITDSEKEKYTKIAAADKVRYQKEMKNYKPPKASDSDSDSSSGDVKKPKKKRAKKDPNAPKKNKNGFLFYVEAHRAETLVANPKAKQAELLKLLGTKWKSLTDEQKAPYTKKSSDDKVRYEKALAAYNSK